MTKWSRTELLSVLASAALALPPAALAGDATDVSYDPETFSERTPSTTAFPAYPSIARRERIEGEATVCFTIDARGRVVRPAIRSSTHKIFERPALRAIKRSSFEPLAEGEEPSPVKSCRTYRFRLEPLTAQS
jgi:TonB family protein